MNLDEKKKFLNLNWNMVLRLILRTFPILPGPEIYDLLVDLRKSGSDLDIKVKEAVSALEGASQLVGVLQEDLNNRIKKIEILKVEYKKYYNLASIEEDKAKAIIRSILEYDYPQLFEKIKHEFKYD